MATPVLHSGRHDKLASEAAHFVQGVRNRNPHQEQFCRVVSDAVSHILPICLDNEQYSKAQILERLSEPDRIITFRVTWQTDSGDLRANRAWRVQHNNSLGPYKGGLRLRRGLGEDTLKALAFEQTLKNSLTHLPMGGAKGGSNFNPKDKSDGEIMRFCQSLMTELYRYIGENVDVPAGDIGVGNTEIGYLFGQYSRLRNEWTGVMTGKGQSFGGSAVRREATGYGCVYFCENVLNRHDRSISGRKILISGAGTVATFAAEKAIAAGAAVVTMSDSDGFVRFRDGMNEEHLDALKTLKEVRKERIGRLADEFDDVDYHAGKKPWGVPADIAMPCATENEIDADDAKTLADNGAILVCEGSNMPSSRGAVKRFEADGVLFAPGKAANAGGVAVSGMELSQNSMRISWSRERVDRQLQETMQEIHDRAADHGETDRGIDYVKGANIAGFRRIAEALLAYGVV